MQANYIPQKFFMAWGAAASATYLRSIPVASQITTNPGAASLTDGFPPLTSVDPSAGGVPPDMRDFNGILHQITAWLQWIAAGGAFPPFDQDFATAINGYPNGAILMASQGGGLWQNIGGDGNTSNPEAGGAGWHAMAGGRVIAVSQYVSSAIFVPNPLTRWCEAEVLAGGAAGGGTTPTGPGQVAAGAGGGAGGYLRRRFLDMSLFTSGQLVTVGAGGVGIVGGTGQQGGSSSIGNLVTATGGNGGALGQAAAPPAGGYAPLGTGTGGSVVAGNGDIGGQGGNGRYAMIGPASVTSGEGGVSFFGSGGMWVTGTGNGNPGVTQGSGGSGAAQSGANGQALAGGAGQAGYVRITEYT